MSPLSQLGRLLLALTRAGGSLVLVTGRALRAAPRMDRHELVRSLAHFGYDSLPLGLAISVFTGGILVMLANINVQRYGARPILGWAAGYAILREFGPLLMALVMSGRIGARNAAELASMSIGGQLEGLKGVGVDPYALLVAPRLFASALAIAALGLFCNLVAIVSGAFFGELLIQVEAGMFFRSFALLLNHRDVLAAVVKMVVFGLLIALVSTRAGMSARGGAQAVGRKAAEGVVASAGLISVVDFELTLLLSELF